MTIPATLLLRRQDFITGEDLGDVLDAFTAGDATIPVQDAGGKVWLGGDDGGDTVVKIDVASQSIIKGAADNPVDGNVAQDPVSGYVWFGGTTANVLQAFRINATSFSPPAETLTLTEGGQNYYPVALTFPGDGFLYTIASRSDLVDLRLFKIDPTPGAVVQTFVGPAQTWGLSTQVRTVAADNTQQLWTVSTAADRVWRWDRATGAASDVILSVAMPSAGLCSAWAFGRLWFTALDGAIPSLHKVTKLGVQEVRHDFTTAPEQIGYIRPLRDKLLWIAGSTINNASAVGTVDPVTFDEVNLEEFTSVDTDPRQAKGVVGVQP